MLLPAGNQGFGAAPDQVIHNREVMGSKVPYHIDIVLKESQVDSHRIIVIELTEATFIQQLFNLLDCPSKQKSMIDHNFEVLLLCEVDQLLCLRNIAGKWLFNKDMFPVFEGSFGELKVSPNWSHNSYCIDFGRSYHLRSVSAHINTRV